MSTPRRRRIDRPLTLGERVASFARRLDKTVLAYVAVFVIVFVGTLWFKFNSLPAPATTIRQDVAVGVATDGDTSAANAPERVPSSQAATPPGAAEATGGAVERHAPANPPQRVADSAAGGYQQTDYASRIEEDATPTPPAGPEGDLELSGRVLTRSGSPVAGIEVTARATRLFEHGVSKAIQWSANERSTKTGWDGSYAFHRLANGEYQLSTAATDLYGKAQIHVRAGVDFADLIVTAQRELRVRGIVTNVSGEPLAGARVRAAVQEAREVRTDRDGRYRFDVLVPESASSVPVRASREGYADKDAQLVVDRSAAEASLQLDIVLDTESDSDGVEVKGHVKDPDNRPVASQRIQFVSGKRRQNYRAVTDVDGNFLIPAVEPSDDYTISMNASDAYQDYFERNIKVPQSGLTLNIKLEERETGVLRGNMVNLSGNAVPDFSLVLQTQATSFYSQQVVGDASGRFEVEQAPAGELVLKTKSNPQYHIEGIRLEPDGQQSVTVVLDWGHYEIHGRVVDEHGQPVAVPNIGLTWSHQQYGLRTTARRTAAADEQGSFRFSQLGPGVRRLTLNAPGYAPVSLNHDVALQGSDLEVKLASR